MKNATVKVDLIECILFKKIIYKRLPLFAEWTIKFDNNEFKGWYTYLSFDDVVNKDNKILVNEKLTICVEVFILFTKIAKIQS